MLVQKILCRFSLHDNCIVKQFYLSFTTSDTTYKSLTFDLFSRLHHKHLLIFTPYRRHISPLPMAHNQQTYINRRLSKSCELLWQFAVINQKGVTPPCSHSSNMQRQWESALQAAESGRDLRPTSICMTAAKRCQSD